MSHLFNRHTLRELTICGTQLIALGCVAHELPKYAPVFGAVFLALLPERVGAIFRASEQDAEEKARGDEQAQFKELLESLPIFLSATHHIVAFPSREAALQHITHQAKAAISIKNSILRYGERYTVSSVIRPLTLDRLYQEWLAAKQMVLLRGPLRELISCHLAYDDPARKLAENLAASNRRYYMKPLDDAMNPMTQVTIIELENSKEVVFGWPNPGSDEGHSFLSTHPRLVAFFEQAFDYNYSKATEVDWADPNKPAKNGLPLQGNWGCGPLAGWLGAAGQFIESVVGQPRMGDK